MSSDTLPWGNLASLVYNRTYSRLVNGTKERWADTVRRVIKGNVEGRNVPESEINLLDHLMMNRKAIPGGRGLWMSGTEHQARFGETAVVNCWAWDASKYEHFVYAQDNLMLGGGVGMSVEHRYVSKLPQVKAGVQIRHEPGFNADFIVPDTREGWCNLLRRVLEAFFETGRGITYSTSAIRGHGEPIKGFGGTASGPLPLIEMIEKVSKILQRRESNHVRPIDAADLLCCVGEMVVAGNVRRSALLILGDPFDREYLRAKDWSRGDIPNYRSSANWSVVASSIEDFHPDFWLTYENGEPYGVVNRKNIQKYGRIGDKKRDSAYMVNPCGETPLVNGEGCNIGDVQMQNIKDEVEFQTAARYMFRYLKRVAVGRYHNPISQAAMAKHQRVGLGLTGCLASPFFNPPSLSAAYELLKFENTIYSEVLGVPESIRTTLIKPAGTGTKVCEGMGYEGIHPAYSRYMIQRIRVASNDPLIPLLREAGHYMEPVQRFDGSLDHSTQVVDFYQQAPNGYPVADEDWDTWKQLDVLKMVQTSWADNAVSVTVYYKREEIPQLKKWLADNLQNIKTISFLCHSDHGFKQAPKEAITREQFEQLSAKVRPIQSDEVGEGDVLEGMECPGGICPIR